MMLSWMFRTQIKTKYPVLLYLSEINYMPFVDDIRSYNSTLLLIIQNFCMKNCSYATAGTEENKYHALLVQFIIVKAHIINVVF